MLSPELSEQILKFRPFYQESTIQDLFSWKELETLLNLRPFVSSERFRIISGKSYEWSGQDWLSDVNTYPPELIAEEIRKYVCYFSDSSRVNYKVNELCNQLESLTNYSTDAHIYFSLEDKLSKGFDIHYDESHNLIVQIDGSTHFRVWSERKKGERRNRSHMNESPILDVIMNPGDIIFIPVHYWHSAHSMTKRLSISFPMTPDNNGAPQSRHWIKINDE
jgi:hypothetical protein